MIILEFLVGGNPENLLLIEDDLMLLFCSEWQLWRL